MSDFTSISSSRDPGGTPLSLVSCAFFGFTSVVIFVICWVWPSEPGWWGPGVSALLAYGFVGIHLATSLGRMSAFDPGLWVPISILLFYFSLPIAVNFGAGYMDYDTWNLGHPPELTHSFVAALLTLVAFLFGFHLVGVRDYSKPIETEHADPALVLAGATLGFGGLLMLVIGIALAGTGILFGSYGDMTYAFSVGAFDARLLTGLWFASGGVFALLSAYTRKQIFPLYLAMTIAGVLAVYLLLIGDRGGLVAFAFGASWAFTVKVRRVSKWWATIVFLAAIIAMPMIKEYRQFKSTEESRTRSLAELVTLTLAETGSTTQVFNYTMAHIPKDKPYDYGLSVVATLVSTIPNVGFSTGKSFELDPFVHVPSKWLVWQINPLKLRQGGGYGHAIGAEWYFNFGIPGIFLGMIATGYLTARIRNAAGRGGLMLAWSCLYTYSLTLLVRNGTIALFKSALWPLAGLLILHFAYSKLVSGTPRFVPLQATAEASPGFDGPRSLPDDR